VNGTRIHGGLTRIVMAAAVMSVVGVGAAEQPDVEPGAQIARLEQEWARCFVTGDPSAARAFIADDFTGISSKGVRYAKAQGLKDIVDSKGKFKSMVARDITVRVYGDAAVAQGTDTWEGTDGSKGSALWTDTWIRTRGTWQIVAAQDTPFQWVGAANATAPSDQ